MIKLTRVIHVDLDVRKGDFSIGSMSGIRHPLLQTLREVAREDQDRTRFAPERRIHRFLFRREVNLEIDERGDKIRVGT